MAQILGIVQTSSGSSELLRSLCEQYLPGIEVRQFIGEGLLNPAISESGPAPADNRALFHLYVAAENVGCDAILNECVVYGNTATALASFFNPRIVRIDEGMILDALKIGKRFAIFGTAKAALHPSETLLLNLAYRRGLEVTVETHHVTRETLAAEAAKVDGTVDAILLAQPSMAALAPQLTGFKTPVLTVLDSGFRLLRDVMASLA